MAIPENSYNNPESGDVSDIFSYDDMHVCSKWRALKVRFSWLTILEHVQTKSP